MFVDTHCHINMMIKKTFDVPLASTYYHDAQTIIQAAHNVGVTTIINVGTSAIESTNCVTLAKSFSNVYATIGTHPNDAQNDWKNDILLYKKFLQNKTDNKIIGIGEVGLDYHYPQYHKQRQYDVFRAQIELALEYNLALIIHTRDAGAEVLTILDEYKKHKELRGIIHCFSEDHAFATYALSIGFMLGIGGTLTYPKNDMLRDIVMQTPLEKLVLETDAPFLPPQSLRGKQNTPANIPLIAQAIAHIKNQEVMVVARTTTHTVQSLFHLKNK